FGRLRFAKLSEQPEEAMEFRFLDLADSAGQAGDAASACAGTSASARTKSCDAEVSRPKTCGRPCTRFCAGACAASSRVERAGYCSAGATVFAFGCGNQLNHFFGA